MQRAEEREERAEGSGMSGCRRYWRWVAAAMVLRMALIGFSGRLKLDSRPEVATPLTSLRRRRLLPSSFPPAKARFFFILLFTLNLWISCFSVAEGYWLKQLGMSPYSGPISS